MTEPLEILARQLAGAPELSLVAILEILRLVRRGGKGWTLEEMKRLSGASPGVLVLVGLKICGGAGVSVLFALTYLLRVTG